VTIGRRGTTSLRPASRHPGGGATREDGIHTPHRRPEPDETACGVGPDHAWRHALTPDGGPPDLCTQVLVFSHLAQIALDLASLPAAHRDDVVRDLDALRHECEGSLPRTTVVGALVGDVVDLLVPDLDPLVARSLLDALPTDLPGDRLAPG